MGTSRANLITFACLAAVLLVVTVIVPATGAFDRDTRPAVQQGVEEGVVRRVVTESTTQGPRDTIIRERIDVELGGRIVVIEQQRTALDAGVGQVRAGDRVLVTRTPGPNGDLYYIADQVRRTSLLALTIAFVALVLVVGRMQGAWSLLGMAASLLVIVRFIVPGILAARDPVLISCVGALAIMLPALYLAHGVNSKTTVALAGTGFSLALTALLASASIEFARLTGTAIEGVGAVRSMTGGRIEAEGLLLAGIIIGALGVLDDVTIGQASTVFELRRANAELGFAELFRRGMNVGRDHIASTVNTLVLAYAGASLPLLVLLANGTEPLGTLINREFLATEIVRTLAGSIGIVSAVPATTALAAWIAGRLPHQPATPAAAVAAGSAARHMEGRPATLDAHEGE